MLSPPAFENGSPPPPPPPPHLRPEAFYWCDGENQVLRQKSLGASIMASDFIEVMGKKRQGCY